MNAELLAACESKIIIPSVFRDDYAGQLTKTQGAFTSDMTLLKLMYLAHNNIKQKWTMPLANWGQTAQKLAIWFPGRNGLRFSAYLINGNNNGN